jgi:quinol monooxygenase YgiN
MICVLATIEVTPGRRDEFLKVFATLAPQVQAEAGCIEYRAMIDLPNSVPGQAPAQPDVVTIVEKWESVAALEAHLMAPHMHQFRKATEQLRRGIALRILEPA